MNITLLIQPPARRWHHRLLGQLAALPGVQATFVAHTTPLPPPETSDLLINLTAHPIAAPQPCLDVRVDGHPPGPAWFWLGMDPAAHPTITLSLAANQPPFYTARPLMQWSRRQRADYLHDRIAETICHAVQRWRAHADTPCPPAPTVQPQPPVPLAILGRELNRLAHALACRWGRTLGLLPPEQFQVYVRRVQSGEAALPQATTPPWHTFTPLPQPPGHFYADPFLVPGTQPPRLLVEDYDTATRKGHIRAVSLEGNASEPVLETAFHLSYPQVFLHDGRYYLLPETAQAHEVVLYAATSDSPTRWQPHATLLANVQAADATLLQHEGSWWLFATLGPSAAHRCDTLHLFYADALEGPYHPHPLNPVVIDASRARAAGPLFTQGDALIRPAQDCLHGYGSAITFNKVELLTRTRYAESVWKRLAPPAGTTGIHHYHRMGDYEAIDLKTG